MRLIVRDTRSNCCLVNLRRSKRLSFLKEGFRYQLKEIASILQTSETAVKSNLHRAKQRLEKDSEPFSTDSFWNEQERKKLSELFYKTLESQDPAL